MNITELNKKKSPIVRIDSSLEKFIGLPLFQDKVDKANDVLQMVGLPVKKKKRIYTTKYTPSTNLAKIVGYKPLPRTEVNKKIWDYIKKNKLQDSKQRRYIIADGSLIKVFGGKKKLSMFEMAKHISKNLS